MPRQSEYDDLFLLLQQSRWRKPLWPSLNRKWRFKVLKALAKYITQSSFKDIVDESQRDFVRIIVNDTHDQPVHLHFYFPSVDRSANELLHLFHHHGQYDMTSLHLCGGQYSYASIEQNSGDSNKVHIRQHDVTQGKFVNLTAGKYHSMFSPANVFLTLVFWNSRDRPPIDSVRKNLLLHQNRIQETTDFSHAQCSTSFDKLQIEKFISRFCQRVLSAQKISACELGLLEASTDFPVIFKTCNHHYPWREMNKGNIDTNNCYART